MQLILKSVAGVRVCDWKSYAMLRDNVQHFLESGVPDGDMNAVRRAGSGPNFVRANTL